MATVYDRSILKNRKRHYETIVIFNPNTKEPEIKALITQFETLIEKFGGNLLRTDDWGKKRMAYEIQKHQQGRYFYFRFIGSNEVVQEFERAMKLDTETMRYQTVRLSDILKPDDIKSLIEKAPEEPSKDPTQDQEDFYASHHTAY